MIAFKDGDRVVVVNPLDRHSDKGDTGVVVIAHHVEDIHRVLLDGKREVPLATSEIELDLTYGTPLRKALA